MGKVIDFLNSRWLIAVVTGLFLLGIILALMGKR